MNIVFTEGQKYDIFKFGLYHPVLLIFFSSFIFNLSLLCFDSYLKDLVNEQYLIRNLLGGGIYGLTISLMSYIMYSIENKSLKINKNYLYDIFAFLICGFLIGFMWQVNTDFSYTLSLKQEDKVKFPVISDYNFIEILCNFILFFVFQSIIFYTLSKHLFKVLWANITLSLQIGLSCFGIYLANFFITGNIITQSLFNGLFAMLFSYIPFIYWYVNLVNTIEQGQDQSLLSNLYGVSLPISYN